MYVDPHPYDRVTAPPPPSTGDFYPPLHAKVSFFSQYMYKLGSTACCARPLRSSLPTAIGFSHGLALARMQSKQRSTSRPGRSALRKLHMSFRGGTGTPHAVPPAVFSLFLLLRRASETDRHAGGWIRYFLARINFSVRGLMYHIYIARAISVDRNSSRRIDRCRDDPCTLFKCSKWSY